MIPAIQSFKYDTQGHGGGGGGGGGGRGGNDVTVQIILMTATLKISKIIFSLPLFAES